MSNVVASPLGSWFVSPAKVALAWAVPASTLSAYDTGTGAARPPTPVTEAVHGSTADPVKTASAQWTSVVDPARAIVSAAVPVDAARVGVPAKLAPTPVGYEPAFMVPSPTVARVAMPEASVAADPAAPPWSVKVPGAPSTGVPSEVRTRVAARSALPA